MQYSEFRTPSDKLVERVRKNFATLGWTPGKLAPENYETGIKTFATLVTNNRGFLLSGAPGTGKSWFVKTVAKTILNRMSFVVVNLKDPSQIAQLDCMENPDEARQFLPNHVILDDLGAEPKYNRFGIPAERVIEFCQYYFENGKGTISVTTNLRGEELLARYAARIDCFKDFLFAAKFVGSDIRKWESVQRVEKKVE